MTEDTGFPPEDGYATDVPAPSGTTTASVPPAKPGFWMVKLSHPNHMRRTVFRSISEKRARDFVERRFPRGSEAHLVSPDGVTESHEMERQGDRGMDAPKWASFDPETYVPVDQAPPPGESEWADKEG